MLHRLQVFYPLWSSSLWLRWMLGLKTALFWEAVMISEDGFPNLNPCNRFEQGGIAVVCLDWVVEAMRGVAEMHHILKFSKKSKSSLKDICLMADHMPLWVWRLDTEAGINASTIINHWPINLGCAASLHLSLGWPYQDDSWESEPTDLESSIGDKGMVGGDDWQVDFEPNGALVMELESEGFGVRVGGFDNAETCRITWWLSYSLSPHVQDFAIW